MRGSEGDDESGCNGDRGCGRTLARKRKLIRFHYDNSRDEIGYSNLYIEYIHHVGGDGGGGGVDTIRLGQLTITTG